MPRKIEHFDMTFPNGFLLKGFIHWDTASVLGLALMHPFHAPLNSSRYAIGSSRAFYEFLKGPRTLLDPRSHGRRDLERSVDKNEVIVHEMER